VAGGIGLGPIFTLAWDLLQWPAAIALVLTGLALVYWLAPAAGRRWHWITPGSSFALLAWLLMSVGLRAYVAHFGNYNATYGSIGGVILLMLWLYLSGGALLIGAEIDSVVAEAVELLRQYAESKGITLVHISAERALLVQGDRPRLKRALFRLAEHAITVSETGSQVVILAESETNAVAIEIIDRGKHESAELILKLFEKPQDIEGATTEARSQKGMGLYVARLIIEAHGGKLTVENQPGPGNTVKFSIPIQA